MRKRVKDAFIGALYAFLLLFLIVDGQTALTGALDGVNICINTVVPALLPYIFLSTLLCNTLIGKRIRLFRGIGRLCRIPPGTESILLLGFVGGYPVGAKLISDAYTEGQIKKSTAQRMLGFCNNAGPSFLFGVLPFMFTNTLSPVFLWLIHVISAIFTAILLPGREHTECSIAPENTIKFTDALQRSVKTVAMICGWVIIFRIVLSFLRKWLISALPSELQILCAGFFELTNGCISLQQIPNEATRFLCASFILAWGGLCVTMQTISVTDSLGLGMYLPGKILQTAISLTLSAFACAAIYPGSISIKLLILLICPTAITAGIQILFFAVKKL